MKKNVLWLVIAVAFLSFSCSSDDDNNNDNTDSVSLAGNWQLTDVDFQVFEEGGIPASDACVIELVAGYQFLDNNLAYVILNKEDFFDPYAQEYWTWTGDTDDFKLVQTNPHNPPYNFGLTPESIHLSKVDGKPQLTFASEMSNGSVAQFTLVKQETIDKTKLPHITKPDGSDYYCGFFDEDE